MRRYAILLLAATGLAGCQTASNDFVLGPTDADVTGTFGLSSINGGPLPIVAQVTTTDEWDLTADTLRISGDSTFTETSFYDVTSLSDGTVQKTQTVASGIFTVANKQITFTLVVGGTATFIGAVQGSMLTLVYNDSHFIYSR